MMQLPLQTKIKHMAIDACFMLVRPTSGKGCSNLYTTKKVRNVTTSQRSLHVRFFAQIAKIKKRDHLHVE
jgi:hypothetical protein